MNLIAFDLETAAVLPQEADWRDHRPLGITCAAIAWLMPNGTIRTQVRHGRNTDGSPTSCMTTGECIDMVRALGRAVREGYTLVTWNGLGFDFDVLAEESGCLEACIDLARGHIDLMYQIVCVKGFPLSLAAAARGMRLAGKTEGLDGSRAPLLWGEGKHQEVLAYVEQDARTTLEVALAVQKAHTLRWITKAGRAAEVAIPQWLTVDAARTLPLPDTSWMKEPLTRESFEAWMG